MAIKRRNPSVIKKKWKAIKRFLHFQLSLDLMKSDLCSKPMRWCLPNKGGKIGSKFLSSPKMIIIHPFGYAKLLSFLLWRYSWLGWKILQRFYGHFSSSFKRWRYFRPLPNLIKTSLKKYNFIFGWKTHLNIKVPKLNV